MKRNATVARSPVRMYGRSTSIIAHVCETGPTWSIAWYFVRMVVACDRMSTASNVSQHCPAHDDGTGKSLTLGNKFLVHLGIRLALELREHDHALAHVL